MRAFSKLFSLVVLAVSPAFPVSFTFFEDGRGIGNNGTTDFYQTGTLQPDPGPGGLNPAPRFSLLGVPFLITGDVVVHAPGGQITSVLRFLGPDSLFFYSVPDLGPDLSFAEVGLPGAFQGNRVDLNEVALSPTMRGVTYTPTSAQPGNLFLFPVTYTFVTDIPEPATFALALAAMTVLVIVRLQRSGSRSPVLVRLKRRISK